MQYQKENLDIFGFNLTQARGVANRTANLFSHPSAPPGRGARVGRAGAPLSRQCGWGVAEVLGGSRDSHVCGRGGQSPGALSVNDIAETTADARQKITFERTSW